MGKEYDTWNTDAAVRIFLTAYHLADAPEELGNALEVLVDPSRRTSKKYNLPRVRAEKLISDHTGLVKDRLRSFIEDTRDHTNRRNSWK